MIAYIDSSIILRIALNQQNASKKFSQISEGVTSKITFVECMRTLDRKHSTGHLTDTQVIDASEFIYEAFESINLIHVTQDILQRSSQPVGLRLGTLDAIHLFSAVLWQTAKKQKLGFFTHDIELGYAAQRFGFEVEGV
jgi:predicted nucleic acid-binding protein